MNSEAPTAPIHPLDAILFSPPREQHGPILSAIASPYVSLANIAGEYNTSIDALCLWLSRPDIQRRFSAVKGASADRARLIATENLPRLIPSLVTAVIAYEAEESHQHLPPTLATSIHQTRRREVNRKSISLLLRIARFQPIHTDQLPPPESPPAPNHPKENPERKLRLSSNALPENPERNRIMRH